MPLSFKALIVLSVILFSAACAVKPTPDPRMPGTDNSPVLLTVCRIDGESVHLVVGDRVELSNSRLGRLRIRHIRGPDNNDGVWNDGETARVISDMLVERIDRQGNETNTRRFVPVGRFKVDVQGLPGHQRFDFRTGQVTVDVSDHKYEACNVKIGEDEILIRGVEDDERHGGLAHLSSR